MVLRWLLGAHVLLPHLGHALVLNAKVRRAYRSQVADAWRRAAESDHTDVDAAVALWQFETDRLNGLATKAAAVLAADALVGAGIATQTDGDRVASYLCLAAIVFLVSAAVSAFLAQRPAPRYAVQASHVLDGSAEQEMVAVVIANEPLGIQLQNLVYVGVRDTFISLILFIGAVLLNL